MRNVQHIHKTLHTGKVVYLMSLFSCCCVASYFSNRTYSDTKQLHLKISSLCMYVYLENIRKLAFTYSATQQLWNRAKREKKTFLFSQKNNGSILFSYIFHLPWPELVHVHPGFLFLTASLLFRQPCNKKYFPSCPINLLTLLQCRWCTTLLRLFVWFYYCYWIYIYEYT